MIKRYGDDAGVECAMRRDELLEDSDDIGAAIWKRIAESIQFLTDGGPSGSRH